MGQQPVQMWLNPAALEMGLSPEAVALVPLLTNLTDFLGDLFPIFRQFMLPTKIQKLYFHCRRRWSVERV